MSVSVLPGRAAASKSGCNHLAVATTTPSLASSAPTSSSENISAVAGAEPAESSTFSIVEANVCEQEASPPARRVAAKRYYSSSESECIQPTSSSLQHLNAENVRKSGRNNNHHSSQHHRGRAAKRRRFQSPRSPLPSSRPMITVVDLVLAGSPIPITIPTNASLPGVLVVTNGSNEVHGNGGGKVISGGGKAGGKAAKLLARVPLTQQPKAPSNTTQFLITDREERESSDRDTSTDVLGNSADFSKLRPRCYSSACTTKNDTSAESSHLMQSSDSDEELEEEDSEFDTIYDNVSLERIQGLPRDKVNREMLTTQKCNSHLVDKVTHLKTENHRLKNLLQQHGIDFNKSISSELNSAVFSPQHILMKQSTSRSSVESEKNSTTGNEEETERIERSVETVKQEKR